MDISLFGHYQMLTFANIGPVLDNNVSFKNLINKTRRNKCIQELRTNVMAYFKNITINVCYNYGSLFYG